MSPPQPQPSDCLSTCLFLRHSSSPQLAAKKEMHLSHHQLSHTVTFPTSVIFIIAAVIPALLSPPNPHEGLCGHTSQREDRQLFKMCSHLDSRSSLLMVFVGCGMVPVLYHDHGHPVRGIHMFTNQVLEKQEWLHQEILKRDMGKKTVCLYINRARNLQLCACFYSPPDQRFQWKSLYTSYSGHHPFDWV